MGKDQAVLSRVLLAILLIATILIPLSFSENVDSSPLEQSDSKTTILLDFDKNTGKVKVIVTAFGISSNYGILPDATWQDYLDGDYNQQASLNPDDVYQTTALTSTIQDAEVYLFWTPVNPSEGDNPGEQEIEGCNPIITSQPEIFTYYDFDGNQQAAEMYYGECYIDPALLNEKCINLIAKYQGTPKSEYTEVVCGEDIPIFGAINQGLQNAIAQTTRDNSGFCLLGFLLAGVLFASMYYSGRNPLSLLDITTPKLPTTKNISVGGSIKAPMSYGRMKSGIKETSRAIGTFFNKYTGANSAFLAAGFSRGRARALADLKEGEKSPPSKEQLTGYEKAMLTRIAERGDPDMDEQLAAVLRSRNDPSLLREVLNRFRRNGGMDKTIGTMVDLELLGSDEMKHMAVFGGGSDEYRKLGASPVRKAWANLREKSVIGRVRLANFPLLGQFVGSVVGNFYSSLQYMSRINKSIASSIANATLNTADRIRRKKPGEGTAAKIIEKARQKALQKHGDEEALSGFGALLARTHEGSVKIGRIWRVDQKMEEQYKIIQKEALIDIEAYMLKRIMSKLGVHEELIGKTYMEPGGKTTAYRLLQIAKKIDGVDSSHIASIEAKMVKYLLKEVRLEGESEFHFRRRRIETLANFANSIGASLDTMAFSSLAKIGAIDTMASPEQKFFALVEHLNGMNVRDIPGGVYAFYHLTGREELWYADGTTDLWSRNLFKSYLEDIDAGNHKYLSAGESLFANSMKANFAKFVNEYCGIQPSSLVKDAEISQLMTKVNGYFKDLAASSETVADPVKHLFNYKMGDLEGDLSKGIDMMEFGPLEGWWKVNMKWRWLASNEKLPMKMEELTVRDFVTGIFQRGFHEENVPRWEERSRYLGVSDREQKREVYSSGYMLDRMRLALNQDSPNAFGSQFNNVKTQYMTVYAEMMRRYARHYLKYEALADNLDAMDAEHVMKACLSDKYFMESMKKDFMEKPVTYDAHKKGVWARTNEGAMIPINEEIPMSSMDIVLNGVIAYKHRGFWKEFRPESFDASRDIRSAGNQREGREVAVAMQGGIQSRRKQDWESALEKANHFAKDGIISGGGLVSLYYSYARATGDWDKLRQLREPGGQKRVQLMSKDEFIEVKDYGAFGGVGKFFRKGVNKFWQGVERNLIGTFGQNAISLDAVNQVSTVHKTRFRELIGDVYAQEGYLAGKPVDPQHTAMMDYVRGVAKTQAKYQAGWEITVDRHPSGSSTAQATMLWMESFYHHGPGAPTPGRSHTHFYTKGQRAAMSLQHALLEPGRRLMINTVAQYRTFKIESEGRPTTYDITGDPMNKWNQQRPRDWIGGLRALVNPMHGGFEFRKTKNLLRKMGVNEDTRFLGKFVQEGDAAYRRLHGQTEYYKEERAFTNNKGFGWAKKVPGLGYSYVVERRATQPATELFAMTRENIAHEAIIGDANPASTYLDLRRTMHYDPRTAEQMIHGQYKARYAEDEELRKAAGSNIVIRNVSPLLHVAEREMEIRHEGGWSGSAFKKRALSLVPLASPVILAGLTAYDKYKHKHVPKDQKPSFKDTFKAKLLGTPRAITRSLRDSWKTTAPGYMGGMRQRDMHYCAYCHRLKPRGQPCNCGGGASFMPGLA